MLKLSLPFGEGRGRGRDGDGDGELSGADSPIPRRSSPLRGRDVFAALSFFGASSGEINLATGLN